MYKSGSILILILIHFFLFFPICFAKLLKLRKIISLNEITITINGTGDQKILSDSSVEKYEVNYVFEELPDEILVNGVYKGSKDRIAYNLSQEINNVTMIWNSSLTNCNCMFYDLSNIISIDFSKFETSQVTNMLYMFNGCTSLVSLDLTNFNTELVTDMQKMFFGCSSLQIVKHNFRAPLAIDISNMFDLCESLISIDLSNFEAVSALFMALMFCNCKSLKTVNLSNFNAEKSLFIDNMFNGCISLETIDLTNFKTSTVSGMANLFFGCLLLESLDLSSFDFSSVTNMGNMFSGCSSLKSVILKNFDTRNVKVMDNMFKDCKMLISLDLSGFNTESVTDMSSMFYGCESLKSLELGNFDTNLVTNMKNMFYNCNSLVGGDGTTFNSNYIDKTKAYAGNGGYLTNPNVVIVNDAIPYVVYESGVLTFYFGKDYQSHTGDVYTNIVRKKKSDQWGVHNSEIKKVVFDQSFAEARPISNANWFNGCTSLTSVCGLEYLNTSEVTTMYAAFNGCKSLSSINLSGCNTAKVNNMGYMFNCCSKLKSIYVSELWTTANVLTSGMMFYGCKSIIGGDGTKYEESIIDKSKAYWGSGGYLTYMDNSIKEYRGGDNNFTNMDDVTSKSVPMDDIYTLQGVKVKKEVDIKSLPKGIYVIGGKKIEI